MVTGYVVVPGEYARCAQLPVRPTRWCGDSSVQSLRLVNSPHVQYSLHLDCEMDLALTEPVKEEKSGHTNLFCFCCAADFVGESKPEKERERGRAVVAFGTKLVRGMTFGLLEVVDAWCSAGGRKPP